MTHTLCGSVLEDNPVVLRVSGLSKAFNGKFAVKDLSFHLKKGEILGILGPNGAGKTTTLHLLLGLIKPTSGEIYVHDLNMSSHREKILERMNFSSSYISMPYNLTVMENLTVFSKLYGIKDHRPRIEYLLRLFDVWDLRNKLTGTLSSGQISRVNLVKALLNDPDILLLDEPTASLDPDVAVKVRTILCRIRNESNKSIIYTSHNMYEVENLCDRLIFLHNGSIYLQGTTEDVLKSTNKRNLEELFIEIASREKD